MKEPNWIETSGHGMRRATGKYSRWNMISAHQYSDGRVEWSVFWSGSHRNILKGNSPSYEQAKVDSVNALENFLRTTFGL